jgi:hypothetical protein
MEFARCRREGAPNRRALILAASLAPIIATTVAAADDKPVCYFAGHAFLAEFAALPIEFPHLSHLLTGDTAIKLDRSLASRATHQPLAALDLRVGELGALAPGSSALVLALAFDRETVSSARTGNDWKLLVEFGFQVLVYDFRARTVRASWPVAVQYIDVLQRAPEPQDIDAVVERLIFGDQPSGLQATFWSTLANVKLPSAGARTLRVTTASLSDGAAASIQALGVTDLRRTADRFAYDLGKFLSGNLELSVLPYASNQATGAKMPARLADGSAFVLSIPEPDYAIELRLDGIKKVRTGGSPGVDVWVYGAFFTVQIVEPLSARAFFNGQIKLGATRTLPAGFAEGSDWPSFAEAAAALLNEFSRAAGSGDSGWAEKRVTPAAPGAPISMTALRGLIDSCR